MGMVPVAGFSGAVAPKQFSMDIAAPAQELALNSRLSASGVLIIDLTSGQRLYGHDSGVRRPMASLTKIMTAVIIAENHSMDEWVKIPSGMSQVPGNKANLPEGAYFTVGDLLSSMLVGSNNDVATTLAMYHSGSVSEFVKEMNRRAVGLGLTNTSYANPSGLDDPNQYSTPEDIAWLTMFALRYPEVNKRMSSRGSKIVSKDGQSFFATHTHALMHSEVGVIAGKTGTTDAAGQCLVTVVEENGRKYVVVLFGSLQRYVDMYAILNVLIHRVV